MKQVKNTNYAFIKTKQEEKKIWLETPLKYLNRHFYELQTKYILRKHFLWVTNENKTFISNRKVLTLCT